MKTLQDLLLLGDERLYQKSDLVTKSDFPSLKYWVADLDNVMKEIRAKYNFGRGIAAPQLGNLKQLIYINIDRPLIIINPVIEYKSAEMMEVWDDCMCFPQLFVKVIRHKTIRFNYKDEEWNNQTLTWHDDLSELFQHEYDHLQGILCTMRAIDEKSYRWRRI